MAQFDVYENLNSYNNKEIPYLLDVQHDILSYLDTRVVIPLSINEKEIKTIAQKIIVNGDDLILLSAQIASITPNFIGEKVCSLKHKRDDIISSIDFLITGF